MAVTDWSTDPNANSTIDGLDIAEGCPAANINGAIRSIMAAVRSMYNALPNFSDLLPKSGGTLTGNIRLNTDGVYLHYASGSMTGGRIFVQASGGAVPAMAEGDILLEY